MTGGGDERNVTTGEEREERDQVSDNGRRKRRRERENSLGCVGETETAERTSDRGSATDTHLARFLSQSCPPPHNVRHVHSHDGFSKHTCMWGFHNLNCLL